MKALVLYDYAGNLEAGELNLKEGTEVTVVDTTLGDGWWEGVNQEGTKGVFPASYVRMLDQSSVWDEDTSNPTTMNSAVNQSRLSVNTDESKTRSGSVNQADHAARNLNRFSPFVSKGAEDFVVDGKIKSADHPAIPISPGALWKPQNDRITISILESEKKSKFSGIKEFIAYKITSQWGEVERRYKHFEWLHARLVEKFTFICLPTLPEKVLLGSKEERFVEKRKRDLERYLNRLARHPVIRSYEMFKFFLTISDEDKARWKASKRAAEKDKVIAGKLFTAISIEGSPIIPDGNPEGIKKFGKFCRAMQRDLEFFLESNETFRVSMSSLQRQYNRMSASTQRLVKGSDPKESFSTNSAGQWDSRDGNDELAPLTGAMIATSQALMGVSKEWGSLQDALLNPLSEKMREYLQLLPPYGDLVELHSLTQQKMKETEKLEEKGKIKDEAAAGVVERCHVVFNVTHAEMNHLHDMRREDFNGMFKAFLQTQIDHHLKIAEILKGALAKFE